MFWKRLLFKGHTLFLYTHFKDTFKLFCFIVSRSRFATVRTFTKYTKQLFRSKLLHHFQASSNASSDFRSEKEGKGRKRQGMLKANLNLKVKIERKTNKHKYSNSGQQTLWRGWFCNSETFSFLSSVMNNFESIESRKERSKLKKLVCHPKKFLKFFFYWFIRYRKASNYKFFTRQVFFVKNGKKIFP